MSDNSSQRNSTPIRTFGITEDLITNSNDAQPQEASAARRIMSKLSLSSFKRGRPSTSNQGGADVPNPPTSSERPPIPTMKTSAEVYSTPLPKLSMIVLSITMLGEFLSANVSTPFLLFMVKGFGNSSNEADVAFWTGILVSTFFLTQFMTSLLWATVAEKHGQRAVLVISLLGSAFTCSMFGTATTLQQAICIRLLQGVFGGAVGVARGCVASVTDPSNEGRAYAILGFCWGFGGVAGAIIGGSFERPVDKWPEVFGNFQPFITFPYLLPCALAATVTLLGSILACFLGPDGGPREGAIRLLPEKFTSHAPIPEEDGSSPSTPVFEEDEPHGLGKIQRRLSRRFSNYFAKRVPDAPASPAQFSVPLSSPNPRLERTRTFSRTSRTNGSAYGYTGSYRNRLASNSTFNARRGSLSSSLRRRRGSNVPGGESAPETSDLNFAQRLLLVNENAVTNIADLWVAAAMNVDNEDPFEDSDDEEQGEPLGQGEDTVDSPVREGTERRDSASTLTPARTPGRFPRSSMASSLRPTVPAVPSPLHQNTSFPHRPSVSFSPMLHSPSRRSSTSVPAIFAHPGVKGPPSVIDAQQLLPTTTVGTDLLTPIHESRTSSQVESAVDTESLAEKPPSIMSQLPLIVIVQYGVMALHTTTHDQIFMSYLVSDYNSGGLGLNAGHFAQLIALMCLFQIVYQFYLYPNIGPPRGRFSHLAMFRLGTVMFIPAYLTVVLYRPFASRDGEEASLFLMFALSVSTAIRYCGTTFGYTAISILLNYMTPPQAVGYANGIAQSIVSLARCVGPVIGGYLWSISVQDNPSGYYFGFFICAGVCALTVVQSLLIR